MSQSSGLMTRKRKISSKLCPVELPTLPMVYPFCAANFYIRDCYSVYFDVIMDRLNQDEIRFITVTGSPGIGKSVFYLYFVPRYRKVRADQIVVTASFTDSRTLTLCRVYYPDRANDPVELNTVPNIPNALYIYDGTPDMKPPWDERMICFTSPHRGWSKYIRKENAHIKLHMPVWTESELYEDNNVLGLGIADTEMRRRFSVFGGKASVCLGTDAGFVQQMETDLFNRVAALDPDQVEDFLHRKSADYDDLHTIFHNHPLDTDKSGYVIGICSGSVEEQIMELIKRNGKE